eukprot:scaffold589507_cov23-Prasinocladus_malaysianus.AAC.1
MSPFEVEVARSSPSGDQARATAASRTCAALALKLPSRPTVSTVTCAVGNTARRAMALASGDQATVMTNP